MAGKAGPQRKADNLTAGNRLFRKCWILNISRPIARIALICGFFFFTSMVTTAEQRHLAGIQITKVQCNISGFHGGEYEEFRFLACYAVWLLYESPFRRNIAPTSTR
jgi:hypothetical protein